MSILRSTFNIRPLLRMPAAPALTRGIRNYDVNTPTEGATSSAIEGDSEPTLDSENQDQESKFASAEDREFAAANKRYEEGNSKGAGELNSNTVNDYVRKDEGKVGGGVGCS